MYQNDITNICMDKYYNELILTNTDINLKNVNYSKNKLIIKNIIKKNDLKKISIFNYNLFEEFCINGNYIMIKWMCLKYKFNKSFIYFSSSNKILNNRENVFLEKYIGYSVINNNLKMLKFGKHFDRKNFMSYLKHRMSSIPNNDTKILKWITKYENEFTIKKIYKNFNINYYYDIESNETIKFISKHVKNIYLCYKISNLTEKKYKILLWLLLNTEINKYDIELISWGKKNSDTQKKVYELLYSLKGEIYFDLFHKNINYIKNTMIKKL